jgi:hypothetical protein
VPLSGFFLKSLISLAFPILETVRRMKTEIA